MKKILSLLFCLYCITNSCFAATYANESNYFYGIKLGENLATLQKQGYNFVFVKNSVQDSLYVYTTDTHSKAFYNTRFDYVNYNFFQNKLLLIQATKLENISSIYSPVIFQQVAAVHGQPSSVEESLINKTKTYTWFGNQTYILLVYDFLRKEVRLYVYDYPSYKEWYNLKSLDERKKNIG